MVRFYLQAVNVAMHKAHVAVQLSSRTARRGQTVLVRIAKAVAAVVGVIVILTQATAITRDGGQTRP